MEFTLSMTFLTSTGEKTTISVSNVKENITQDEAVTLMDAIIANDIFQTSKGNFVAKSAAQVTERKVTKFEI